MLKLIKRFLLLLIAFVLFLLIVRLINDRINDKNLRHLADNRYNSPKVKPKIFCIITTNVKNHENKAIFIKNTWAKKCDQFLFLSSTNSTTLPAVSLCKDDDRNHLWCKTKSGFLYIYDNYINQFDWFLKADDDTYIVVQNLKAFLSTHSPESPVYFGCKFKYQNVVYMSGGAGYVLSREALRRFAINSMANPTNSTICKTKEEPGAEDIELGHCLQNFGVIAGDSRDESLKPRFFPFEPWVISLPTSDLDGIAPWFHNYSVYPHKSGPDCCSPTVISFHYVSKDVMHLIDFLLDKVNVVH